jgi:hypothetical protein
MSNGVDFSEVRRRTGRAFFQDGLMELVAGLGFASWAGFFFAHVLFEDAPMVLCWAPWAWLLPGLVIAKRRYSMPRMGHVQIASREFILSFLGLAVILMAGLLLLGVMDYLNPQDSLLVGLVPALNSVSLWIPLLVGAFLSLILVTTASRFGVGRFYWYGLLSLISGLTFSILDAGPWADVPIKWASYLAAMAVVILPWGLITFVRFLRDNPVLEEEADDGAS